MTAVLSEITLSHSHHLLIIIITISVFLALYASAALLLAADVQDGQSVRVHTIGSGLVPLTLPTLKDSRPAGAILLREDGSLDSPNAQAVDSKDKDKRRNWLVLLLRETLSEHQLLEITIKSSDTHYRTI